MKKRTLLFTMFAGLLYITLSSNKNGPAAAGTGIALGCPGAIHASCADAGCHDDGATNATFIDSILVKDKVTGAYVTSYIPGKMYSISVNAHNSNLLSHFGFQAVIFDAQNANAGTFTATMPGTAVRTSNSIRVVEHTAPITSSVAILKAEFDWLAPAKNTGPVTLYTMINAVNFNLDNTGDQVSPQATLVISENTNSGVGNIDNTVTLTAYPNPVHNLLNIKIDNGTAGTYQVNSYDMTGRVIYTKEVKLNSGLQETYINTKGWPAGLYQVQIVKDVQSNIVPVLKQ